MTGAAGGGVTGGMMSAASGNDAKTVLKDTVKSATAGAIIGTATAGIGYGVSSIRNGGTAKAAGTGNGGSGTGESVKSNLGNEIDITPSDNHTAVSKNPGPKGNPNSSVDILDDQGNIITRRWYDSNGNAYRDVDMTNHGNSKTHPEYPHEHTWNWSDGIPKRSK